MATNRAIGRFTRSKYGSSAKVLQDTAQLRDTLPVEKVISVLQ
jgi:hypothetical protein